MRILRDPFLIGILLIRVNRRAQDVSLYTHAWRPSKAMLNPSKVPVNFLSRCLGCLTDVIGLGVKSSALKRTRRPYNIFVFFSESRVWLMGSLRPTASPYVNKFNTFFGITLISCPLLHGSVSFN